MRPVNWQRTKDFICNNRAGAYQETEHVGPGLLLEGCRPLGDQGAVLNQFRRDRPIASNLGVNRAEGKRPQIHLGFFIAGRAREVSHPAPLLFAFRIPLAFRIPRRPRHLTQRASATHVRVACQSLCRRTRLQVVAPQRLQNTGAGPLPSAMEIALTSGLCAFL